MIAITLNFSKGYQKKLEMYAKKFRGGLIIGLTQVALMLEAEAKRRAPVKTGNLRRSIKAKVVARGKTPFVLIGSVVKYAALQEFGGRIFVAPKFKQALHWIQNGQHMFSKGHWITIKPKRFVSGSVADFTRSRKIHRTIAKAIKDETNK